MGRLLATAAAIIAALAVAAAPAAAQAAAPPDDVAAFFADEAPALLPELVADVGSPAFADAALGEPVREVVTWSSEFLADTDGDPTASIQEWIAPVVDAEGEPLGVLRAHRPSGTGEPAFAQASADAGLAAQLLSMPEDALLVSDPMRGAWFAIVDDEARPLDASAAAITAEALPVDELRAEIAARQRTAQTDGLGGWSLPPALLVGGVVALLVAAGVAIAVRLRRGEH